MGLVCLLEVLGAILIPVLDTELEGLLEAALVLEPEGDD